MPKQQKFKYKRNSVVNEDNEERIERGDFYPELIECYKYFKKKYTEKQTRYKEAKNFRNAKY